MPRTVWREKEAERRGENVENVAKQGTLDGLLIEAPLVPVFMHENLLHMVTQFVAVDDQVRSVIV